MRYYTLATKTSLTYGHGDNGDEYHICPIDSDLDNKKFHPLFTIKGQAEDYMKLLKFDYNMVIVELTTYGSKTIQLIDPVDKNDMNAQFENRD